jgi:hypothetical protein
MDFLNFFSIYNKFIIISILVLAVSSLIDKALAIGIIAVIFCVAFTMFFILKIEEKNQKKMLGALFLIAFLLHILIVLFLYYTKFQPFSGGFGDYVVYQQQAEEISQRVGSGNFSLLGIDLDHYYPVIVGYFYAITVPSMLLGQLFNAWLVALTIIFVYLIVRQIGGSQEQGFLTGLIASLYPSLAFYGSLLLKDALVVLLSVIGLLLTIKVIKKFSWQKFLIFYIVLTGLMYFRFYIGYALMFGFIASWFLASTFDFKKRAFFGIIILFVLGFSPQLLNHGYYGFKDLKTFLNPATITYFREVGSVPTPAVQTQSTPPSEALIERRMSSIVVETGLENPFTFTKNSSLSFIYSLLGPFPWQMARKRHLFMLIEIIPWYFLFFFIIKGAVKSFRKQYRDILPLIIFTILVIGALSLFITNFGVITRIRMPAFLALLCLLPFGSEKFKKIKIPVLEKYFK